MMPPREDHHGEATKNGDSKLNDNSHRHSQSPSGATAIYNEQSSLLPFALPQTTSNDNADQTLLLSKARRLLYLSHFFAQFSEVAWQFCLILFLAAFANYNSLILVSSYGFVSYGTVCIFGASTGRFVDGANRLFVAQRFIVTENICVLLASACCYVLLGRAKMSDSSTAEDIRGTPDYFDMTTNGTTTTTIISKINDWFAHRYDGVPLDSLSIILLVAIHVLGALAMCLDKGFLVAVERDWIVVMSQYASSPKYPDGQQQQQQQQQHGDNNILSEVVSRESKDWLSKTNVTMKQIDLSCKVVAPAAAGFLIAAFDDGTDPHHGRDLRGAAIMVGAINAAALIVEYICTARIYKMLPALAIKTASASSRSTAQNQSNDPTRKPCKWGLSESMEVYFEQSMAIGGVSLSLLYLNVLSFGGIMTAYLVWRGMGLETIGIWRGISSAVGLCGTFAYHFSVKRMTLMDTGMWSIAYQFGCLSLSYLSLFIEDYNLSLTLLIVGVISSRIGLWVFDIAITQLMQEYVPDGIRGVVGGVQQSMNAFFFLLSFGLGFVFPDPKDFHIYVAAGYASVGVAMILYAVKVYAKQSSFPAMH